MPAPSRAWKKWLKEMWNERARSRDLYDFKHWSERTVIALVMQTVDNSITTFNKKIPGTNISYMTSRQGHGTPNPTWIPVANEAVTKMAEIVGGTAGGSIGEPFNRPLTAHFIGGCTIGDSPRPASSTRTSGSTATPGCTSRTARRSPPTWA